MMFYVQTEEKQHEKEALQSELVSVKEYSPTQQFVK